MRTSKFRPNVATKNKYKMTIVRFTILNQKQNPNKTKVTELQAQTILRKKIMNECQ